MWSGCPIVCNSSLHQVSSIKSTIRIEKNPNVCVVHLGDHKTSLWQLRESSFEHIRTFEGHTRSVKTVAFRRTDATCFATGGRDNAILIWDTRAQPNQGKADNRITGGHASGPGTPQAYRKSTRQTPKLPPHASSSSITGLAFQDDYTLVSCGGGDGIIKVWDLRRNYTNSKKEPKPKHSIPYPGTSTYQGYSNLLIDSTGQKLYVNCMDHNIYCFNLGVYATQPIMSYTGLTNSTFYIKSSLSPDDQYLISGSKDEKAYIWNVNSSYPILALAGHAEEVTCVAWAKTNEFRIVTCSDDSRHKIWRINNDNCDIDTTQNYMGKAEWLPRPKTYTQMPLTQRLKDLENTPRSLKRIVELNETTPSSTEKCTMKRTFDEMSAGGGGGATVMGGDSKRQLIETRARRLFAPITSTSTASATTWHSEMSSGRPPDIREEIETPPKDESIKTTPLLSPLNERNQLNHYRLDEIRTPSSSNRPTCSQSLFSPTSNLPNYVIDGDAPHLKLQSPKRKLKENIDWLTKIRKQKQSSSVSRQLTDKMNETMPSSVQNDSGSISTPNTIGHHVEWPSSTHHLETSSGILSPRMRKFKSSDRNACRQRRMSSCQSQLIDSDHEVNAATAAITTPTRRKSETTLLRYFCVTPTTRSREQSPAAQSRPNQ